MSNLIHTSRTELGVSNAELARRIGVTPGAVSQLERSEREGTIRWNSLERALSALGRRPQVRVVEALPGADYGAEAITNAINRALDSGDETFALRLLTRAAQVVRESPVERHDEMATRWSRIADPQWEVLFGAVYGAALAIKHKPGWAYPARLPRRWYVSQFPALRERARHTTPEALRALNIYLDERSLARA